MIAAQPAIDLTRYAFVRQLGDMSLYGTWLMNDSQESTEPCLVVIPSNRTTGFRPAVIALSAAFRYNDPRYLARASSVFARNLGMDSMVSAHKLANLIFDHLGDLVTMPEDPQHAIVVGEASITMDGRKRSLEVVDYEQAR